MEDVDRDNLTRIIMCAKFPLQLSSHDLHQFGKNGSYFGAYAIGANIDSVIPIKPEVPLMMTDPVTGETLKCDKFVVRIGANDNPDIGGNISYEDFASGIEIDKLEKFDENHVILRDFSEEMVKDFISKYPDPLK